MITATEPDHLPRSVERTEISLRDGRPLAAAAERAA